MAFNKHTAAGKITAIASFVIGTGIFGLYYLTSADGLLFFGLGFIVLAGLLNIVVLAFLIINAITDIVNRKKSFQTSALMLLNIPVVYIYYTVVVILMNTMRITFTNTTQTELTDLNITGCETKHIDKLAVGETKTVWIGIHGDCAINLNYMVNGQRKEEDIDGYATNGSGKKMNYLIGSKNS